MKNDPPTIGHAFIALVTALAIIVLGLVMLHVSRAHGRDLDGRYAQSPLKPWFDQLKSGKGLCCSIADGRAVADPDWETKDGHYRVRIDGTWIDVPDDAVIKEPNRAGQTMVWRTYLNGYPQVHCFLPGSMT